MGLNNSENTFYYYKTICTDSHKTIWSERDNSNTVGGYKLGSMVHMDVPASANIEILVCMRI